MAVYFEGTAEGDATDNDGDGREEVAAVLTGLDVTGLSSTLGPVRMTLNPNIPSLGEMEETANSTAGVLDLPPFAASGTADSFFDVFFQIEVAGQTYSTRQPAHWAGVIHHKPAAPGDLHGCVEPVELYDQFGLPTGILLTVSFPPPHAAGTAAMWRRGGCSARRMSSTCSTGEVHP